MKRIKKRADFGGIFSSTIAPVINGIGGVLDSTLSTQGVNQFKTEDTSTETNDVVAMRYGGNARPKCWLGAAIGAATGLASGLIGGAASRKAAKKAAALRNRQNMIQDMQGRDKQLNALYSTYLNNNDNEEDLIYRRGGTATQHPRRRNLTDAQYYSIMKQVAADNWRKWGDASPAAAFNRAINSNAYDYRGYYNKYPNSRANADTHWTDEFKGVGEKTFSDQSKYSGVKHPKYNPNGIRGGHWYGASENMFVPNIQQLVERNKFARGGKSKDKKKVTIKITDGGVAQRIGNNTFILRGGSHEQVNPSGQTGIGIKVGNNEIEAEGGEVAQRVGNALRIFSAQPIINGISPAQAVEAGANKNKIFAIQEALKRNYKNNNVFRNGGIKKAGPTYNPETKSWYNADGAKLKKGHGYYSQAANKFVQYNSDGSISKFTINQWAKLKGKTQSYNVGNKAIQLNQHKEGNNLYYSPKRIHNNVSPTKVNSEKHENWVNQSVNYIGNNKNEFSKQGINLSLATPYGNKEVIINTRPVSANMLDSIAYNAGLSRYNDSQLPYAFGIPAHETKNGRTIGSTTDKKQQRINYNANTFRNYGVFNSASLLNDYHNENKGVSDYYHALDLFRRGLYNTKDPDHRSLVYNAGIAEWNDKNFQKYWKEQGSKQYQRGLKDRAKKQYYDKLILSDNDVRDYYKRLAKLRYFRCGGRVKFEGGGDTGGNKKWNWYTRQFEEKTPIYNNLVEQNPKITGYETTSTNSTDIANNNTSSNVNSAPINNWWNRNGMSVNSSDWIGLGTDLAGSLALGALNANAYKNLKYDYKIPNYVDETPVAFDTTYHNGAQRATVERNRLNAQKIIANNTSSANTAVQRMQQANADAMMETNKLWDEKANKEAELRNTAAQNEQQVRARNAAARNQYYQNVAEIQNKRIDAENANRLARSNAWTTSLQGLQGAANNFLNSTRQRFEDENALMATIAAGDAATPYRMMAFGTQFGPRVINAIRAMNNIEGMKDPGAAPVRSNYSNDADYSAARSKWETAMRNYEYWKQRNEFLSHYDRKGYLIKRK